MVAESVLLVVMIITELILSQYSHHPTNTFEHILLAELRPLHQGYSHGQNKQGFCLRMLRRHPNAPLLSSSLLF